MDRKCKITISCRAVDDIEPGEFFIKEVVG